MVFAENKRSTEPYSFILLKKLCSLTIIILLLYYSYDQLSQYYKSISKPKITFHNLDIFDNINITIGICGQIENCTYNDKNKCRTANDIPIEYARFNSPGCSRYSRYTFDYESEIIIEIIPNITYVYLDGLEIDKYYISDDELNLIYNPDEQITVVYYSPIIIKRISRKYAYGLAGGEGDEYVRFNAHTDITTLTTPNITTLVLRPLSMNIYYQEETYYDLGSITSSIGGFYTSLSGIFVFLFGASKLAPWKLKSKYETIPFVSGRIKNVTLEERVQSIENLLEEYYLNTDFLKLLLEENKDNSFDDKV
ncbi:16094_t:CDS:2 [Rhizophagus irregularis]|nr:16094_t:CDS:2 [Rhizophagus irregularis]